MSRWRIDVCGVTGNTGALDADGIRWAFWFAGGWDSPEEEQQVSPVTGRPGARILQDKDGPRRPTVEGTARAASNEACLPAYRRLTGAMPGRGKYGDLIVHEPGGAKLLTVKQGRRPIVPYPSGGVIKFQLDLVAEYPYLTDLEPTVVTLGPGQTLPVTNDGTAPAYLTVEATTAGTVRLRQNDSGQLLQSKGDVAAGTVFDARRKLVTLAGVPVIPTPAGSPSEWLSVAEQSAPTVTNEGTASLDVSIFNTYA